MPPSALRIGRSCERVDLSDYPAGIPSGYDDGKGASNRDDRKRTYRAAILVLRGQKVMLDNDLAALYEVETRALVQAVKRNAERFPGDFMFRLVATEMERLRSQSVISKTPGRGGRRYAPYAFTEQGVAMLSTVLNSARAIAVNIEIMRAFVHLRAFLATNKELARRLNRLETKTDANFTAVFEAIRQLTTPPESRKRSIGFVTPKE